MEWPELEKIFAAPVMSGLVWLGGVAFAVFQAKRTLATARREEDARRQRDQNEVLIALAGELSANIYLIMDILDEATKIGSKLNLQRKLFDSNSTRIGIRNSRAYAWLAVIYGRLSVFVDPLDGCIDKDVLARHLGHAILMRFALREMYEKDNRNIQLSEVSDADFESYIHGYMLREQDILRVARKAWLDTLIEKGRS